MTTLFLLWINAKYNCNYKDEIIYTIIIDIISFLCLRSMIIGV